MKWGPLRRQYGENLTAPSSQYDAIIVGAGPVGGYAALELSKRGAKILMLEEHSEIGRPFQCAGLVTPEAMVKVGLEHTILSDVVGARIHSPKGNPVPIGTEERVRTHVVCRKLFDQGLVAAAMAEGATLWLSSQPTGVEITDTGVNLDVMRDGKNLSISAKLLIGADGAHSWVRRTLKLGNPKEWMIGFQIEVTGYSGKDGWLDMYTGQEVAPGLFAWVIPNGETHRVGVWSRPEDLEGRSCEQLVENLMSHPLWAERFANCRETARHCGPIPAGMVRKPFAERALLLGDAAGLAKPTTGGGIGPGFQQVDNLVEALSIALSTNSLTQKQLKRICKPLRDMRKSQDQSRALRDFFVTSRSDEELERNFSLFAKPEVLELINSKGEIERPVALGISLLKEVPEFRMMALKAGVAVIFS